MGRTKDGSVRTSVTLSPDIADFVLDQARHFRISEAEIIRRALRTQRFFDVALGAGGKILVQDRHGVSREVLFIQG